MRWRAPNAFGACPHKALEAAREPQHKESNMKRRKIKYNMKHLLQTLLALAFCSSLTAQNLQLGWAYANGSTGADGANDIAVDAVGNTYVTGYFSGTVDFDMGPGVANLSTPPGQTATDAFVLKLDVNGNYVWAIRIGGTMNANRQGINIAFDNNGNLVVTGTFFGNVLLPPGNTNYVGSLTNRGSFIMKLDTAGNAIWSRAWANSTHEMRIRDIDIDASNRIVAVGWFNGSVNFSTTTTPNTKTSAGGFDIFVMKLNQNGDLMQVQTGGNANNTYASNVTVCANRYWISGSFNGTVDFNFGQATNNLTSNGSAIFGDLFLLRLDTNLTYIGAFALGGNTDFVATNELVSVDGQYVYHVGDFRGTNVDFNPSPTQTTLFGSGNNSRGFIQKFDNLGNLVWARAWTKNLPNSPSTTWNYNRKLAVMPNGDINILNFFQHSIDAHPNPNGVFPLTCPLPSSQDWCQCLIKLSSNGVFQGANLLSSGLGSSDFTYLATHESNLLLASSFVNPSQLFSNSPTASFTSAGMSDMLIAKLLSCQDTLVSATATSCGSYTLGNGQVVTQSGTYTDTLQTAIGCDSLVSLSLTINPLPNATVTQTGATFTAQPGFSYQWFNCQTNQPIAGETAQTFTATANGQYAVIVSNTNCADTSICYSITNIGLHEAHLPAVSMYPNPTNGQLRIETAQPWQKAEVIDLMGRIVISQNQAQDELDLTHLASGIYLVKVYFREGVVVQRVVKE